MPTHPDTDAAVPVHFNDRPLELPPGCTVAGLLERQGLAGRRVAVEVNREIVPRGAHATRRLEAGDRVEVVHALGGG